MALILKRYEAQNQVQSPNVKQKRSIDNGKQPLASGTGPSTSGQGPMEKEKSNSTANNSSKDQPKRPGWRKVRKAGSLPAPSPRGSGPNENGDIGIMFGQELAECPTGGEDDPVPLLIQLCIKVVEAHGLQTVGVYRIPGNSAAVNSLIAGLNKGFEHVRKKILFQFILPIN